MFHSPCRDTALRQYVLIESERGREPEREMKEGKTVREGVRGRERVTKRGVSPLT